jgi:hypothetical protein
MRARGEHYAEAEAIILYDQPLRAGGKEALWPYVRLLYSASPSNSLLKNLVFLVLGS